MTTNCATCGHSEGLHETIEYRGVKPRACLRPTCHCMGFKEPDLSISESTIAKIAGILLSGVVQADLRFGYQQLAEDAVNLARMIAAEVERTRPKEDKA